MSKNVTFFELADQLDKLIPLCNPTQEQVEEVMRLITNNALEQYFFKHLAKSENTAWFEPLRKRVFFSTPPEPIQYEGDVSYPQWPALWYLTVVAPQFPEEIIEIAGQLHTQNEFFYLEFVRAAQRIPPAYAIRMVSLILRWVDEGMRVGEDVVSLAIYLAKKDQWESVLTLIELILSPKKKVDSRGAGAKAETYFVKWFVEKDLALFLEQRPLKILEIVERNLNKALEIENTNSATDSSSSWRPAIEPHEQNWGFGEIKDLLVDALVQVLACTIKDKPDQGRSIVEKYLRHSYSIFRRLAIHCIRTNARLWPDLVENLFSDEKFLDEKQNYQVYHEYWMLMSEAYPLLPAPVQNKFAEHLIAKLPSAQAEDQSLYHHQRHWVLRCMWAIKDSLHTNEHRNVLAELIKEYGEPEHPSFLSYSKSRWGSVSPRTPDELIIMPLEDILAELRKVLPTDSFDAPTQEGLADVLETAIVKDPEHFTPIAPELCKPDIPTIYTYKVLLGFRDALKEKEFNWEPVLELCELVSRTGEPESEIGGPLDVTDGYWMTTYAGARSAVGDLLEAGMRRDDKVIPSHLLPRVRDILLLLADDLNPSPEYEQLRIAERVPYDVLTVAINVTRGKAIEALLSYALYKARISSQEPEQSAKLSSKLEDEVKNKLTVKLDKSVDPSLAVHSLFGKFLPNLHYLDKEWLHLNLESIFPRQPEMVDYWKAAWDGYMFRADFFSSLYTEMLKPYYRFALEQLALGEQGNAGSSISQRRLAQHLAFIYWHGADTLEDDNSLVALFFISASDELRAVFIGSLGTALREVKPDITSEGWLRARNLWETRFGMITACERPPTELNELGAYTGWVQYIPGDLMEFYPMIKASALISDVGDVNRLIEFLSANVVKHTGFAVSLIEDLLKLQEKKQWLLMVSTTTNNIYNILFAAMGANDEKTKSSAVRVINHFGELGNERYRDLLNIR